MREKEVAAMAAARVPSVRVPAWHASKRKAPKPSTTLPLCPPAAASPVPTVSSPASSSAASSSDASAPLDARTSDALELRRRLLDEDLSSRECLAWLPASVSDSIGARALNIAGVKKHYRLLSMLVHPDKHPDASEEERFLWTEAYKRLVAAKSDLLTAMGYVLSNNDDDDDDDEAQALVAAGKYGEATARYRKVAAQRTAELGPSHPTTFRTKLRLATVLRTSTNQTGEAEGARKRPNEVEHAADALRRH